MRTISWVPGAVGGGVNIDLPTGAPYIDAVVAAEIVRLPSGIADHPQADIIAAIADHPQADIIGAIADHTLDTQAALGGAVTNALGHDAVPQLETAAAANVNIAGCISTHAAGAAAVAHAAGAAVVAHTGGDPVVAATPTKVDEDTITLNVATLVGDVLYLTYMEEGARVLVS